jgi:hypothetical protein
MFLFYLVNALSVVIASILISFAGYIIFKPKGTARVALLFILSLLGAALGLIGYTILSFSALSRIVRFFIQFGFSISFSAAIVFTYFYIRNRPERD